MRTITHRLRCAHAVSAVDTPCNLDYTLRQMAKMDRIGARFLVSGFAALMSLQSGALANSKNFTLLYSFKGGTDGAFPVADLIADKSGNLYGTTSGGGTGGTVFKLAPDGTETVLYSFCSRANCSDGFEPAAGLIMDKKGNLYGTTYEGGTNEFAGTVFKVTPGGHEKVLYSFCNQDDCPDGDQPEAGLIADASGNLYGTTTGGGTSGAGIIFKVAPDGTETVLYSFCSQVNCADGGKPEARLIADAYGSFYGTTTGGGTSGAGTIFKVAPDGIETVLYSFCSQANCADGANPEAGLIADASDNLYGTTSYGGTNCDVGCGTVFKVAPDGTETVLYSFCSQLDCADGTFPLAGLVADTSGNLYGTTFEGGTKGHCSKARCGIVFKVTPDGTETVLHSFRGHTDGDSPRASLLMDTAGDLYGTTNYGGGTGCGSYNGCGDVFQLKK